MATTIGPIIATPVPSTSVAVASASASVLAGASLETRQNGIMPEYEYHEAASQQQYHQQSPYQASISPQPTISIDRGGSGSSYSLHQHQREQYRQPQASPSPSHSYSQSPNPVQSPYTPSPSAYVPSSSSNPHLATSMQYYASPSPVSSGQYSKATVPPPPHQPSPTKYQQPYTPNGSNTVDGGMDWQQHQAGPSRSPSAALQQDRRASAQVARTEYEDERVGTEDPFGERSYTEIKCLGDGSFGTVWLCDWHSPVRQDTYLSAMQCGAGARPEWAGKRLVALKRMKRVWENGWAQAKNLGELASLRLIPPHDNIIPLYDAFISPKSRELYFVFECMEGNLYQLTKSRRGRPLAAGLIASCFHQISAGLYHIHQHGYFHRDMKPENLLVTTTGLTDYLTATTLNAINASRSTGSEHRPPDVEMRYEKDVSVIVKLADFGLARATKSKPPYTEYVSTRWYRAPEVLLRSREYGAPVDMWALGTILAEMVNLKPLFPGVSEIDQVYRICGTLGDPSAEYGHDERGKTIGGGAWNTGIKLAKNVGFSFPKRTPVHFRGLFNENVPQSLVDCILDLLRYNPRYRLTSAECVEHPYFHETLPHLRQTPPIPRVPFSQGQPQPRAIPPTQPLDAAPRQIPPSHSHQALSNPPTRPAFADGDMRTLPPPIGTPDGPHSAHGKLFFPSHAGSDGRVYGASALVNQLRELDLPTEDLASYGVRPVDGEKQWDGRSAQASYTGSQYESSASQQPLSMSSLHLTDQPRDRPTRPSQQDVAKYVREQQIYYDNATPRQGSALTMPPIEPIEPDPQPMAPPIGTVGKKKKWGLSSVFGSSEKHLPPVEEHSGFSGSSTLKRTQSGNPAAQPAVDPSTILDPKKAKKEAERQAKEAEKARRELLMQQQKERARAVMRKREQVIEQQVAVKDSADFEWDPSAANDGRKVVSKADVGRLGYVSVPTNNLGPIASMANLHDNNASTSHIPSAPSQSQLNPGASSSHLNPMGASSSRLSLATALRMPANQSVASVRSLHHPTNTAGPSEGGQLSMAALAARDRMEMEKDPIYSARHKSRRRDDDADHSRSSLDVNSLKSRSALTIGTIDSDPGPRRLNVDPLLDAQARRHASHGYKTSQRSSSKSRLMSGSNLSQESQLAHDFRVHANVASSSSTSLGRHGQSSMNLHDVPPVPTHYMQQQGSGSTETGWGHGPGHSRSPSHGQSQGSAPTSPYGHPKGTAVAMGQGIGRDYVQAGLPPINDWEGQGMINPMFRVPPAQGQPTTTLPPFSTLANLADQQRPKQSHDR